MAQEVVMVMGYPASGKSTVSKRFVDQGYVHINRDKEGGKVARLLPTMQQSLHGGKSIVLDSLFPTVDSRYQFIQCAQFAGVPIRCILMDTSIEDSMINALHRMWDRNGKILFDHASLKVVKSDPNMFPIVVFFVYKKEYQKPYTLEGFSSTTEEHFVRKHDPALTNKAIIFDYDDTLRRSQGRHKFPVTVDDIVALPRRTEVLRSWAADGYLLLGASNQSGVARKQFATTAEEGDRVARRMFEETNRQLGVDIDVVYCPHSVPPNCYCRKPQSGMGVHLIRKHNLDPRRCYYVGDQTMDKTFAKRLGIEFLTPADVFK